MQIRFDSLSAVGSTGPGSVFDLGLEQPLFYQDVWMELDQTSGLADGNCYLEYSVDNSTWTQAGEVSVHDPNGITGNNPSSGATNCPVNAPVTARYLRANLTSFGGSGTLTATIVVNG